MSLHLSLSSLDITSSPKQQALCLALIVLNQLFFFFFFLSSCLSPSVILDFVLIALLVYLIHIYSFNI